MNLENFIAKYKKPMNIYEINSIADNTIKFIKQKYWDLYTEAFKNVDKYNDLDFCKLTKDLETEEIKELTDYFNQISNK